MALTILKSEDDVKNFIQKTKTLTLVYFFAPWAVECQQITDVFETLANESENTNTKFGMVNAEGVQGFCKCNAINTVPSVLFFRDGKLVTRVSGANPAELTKAVTSMRGSYPSDELNTRLKILINRAPIMLFMKGTPEEVRCGFSRRMLDILQKHNVKFDSFDILTDNTVREGLKKYSDWPTYPQLYVKGELIGGVDIVAQLDESNEFESVIKVD